jgi:hypothetical protein
MTKIAAKGYAKASMSAEYALQSEVFRKFGAEAEP